MSSKSKKMDTPLSETIVPKLNTGTLEDTVEDLRRLVMENPEKVISRNYYRVHGKYSESTWNSFFGTFLEFKRQAGIILTRHQHSLEKNIAKHASVDHYRKMTSEKRGYEGKYLRDKPGRFKTVLIGSDLHDKECDPFFLEVFLDTAKRIQPDDIVLNGDIFDLPEFGKYTVDPRHWDVVGRIKFVHEHILAPLRESCPNSNLVFIEGNHEFRLLRSLSDATPALKAVLGDLHGMTVSSLLGLDAYEVNYVAKADLSAYNKGDINKEISQNYKIFYGCLLTHHFTGMGKALGVPGISGHHHKWLVDSLYNETFGSYQWVQNGCGHKRDAEYCNGKLWNLGFTIANLDVETKSVNFDCIPITSFAVVGGKFYYRDKKDSGIITKK